MFDGPLTAESAYERMLFIRRFEDRAFELSLAGEIAGSIHLCFGQEAIPVGALAALGDDDRIIATYRGHGWALACGADPQGVMAEICHRSTGVNGGRAGSPLLSDVSVGFLGENSIVGAGFPIATGVALAAKLKNSDRVVLASVGDGAMNQGSVTEAMAFAAAKDLPVIFLCENNGWSEMTPISATTRGADLVDRGNALGIDSHVVDGNDPFAVRDAVRQAAEQCRKGAGPVFLECKTARLKGHYNRDIEHYRSQEDKDAATAVDPLLTLAERFSAAELSAEARALIDAEIEVRIDDVVTRALSAAPPDPSTVGDDLWGPVVVPPGDSVGAPEQVTKEMTYQRAINQALRDELQDRPEVVVYGEDVGKAGGIFGVTRSLQKDFGSARVFDTPIAESAILGSAVGAAIEGFRPVVEIMWADFLFVALDQIVNQAANVRYLSRSQMSAPLTIRTQQGATPGSCAQHSQSVEVMLAHIPGIKVGLPATPQDAYDMTRAAIADPDPTVLIEHRGFYQNAGEVRHGAATQTAAGAKLHRSGSDIALITWGSSLPNVLSAAEQLAAEGVQATVLDLRWLRPLDEKAIDEAVQSSGGRVLVVHEAPEYAGFGSEVVAQISQRHFGRLASPVQRLGAIESRIPASPVLQDAALPTIASIVEAARTMVADRA
jgi:2-oxoisovalerate dehydrogenase E1 component